MSGNPYHPSVARFEDLKKIMIKELMLETNHRGSYALLRFVCEPMRMTAVMNIAEDEAGTVVPFALYLQEPENIRPAETILNEKRFAIFES